VATNGSLALEEVFGAAAGLPFAVLVAQGPREGGA